MDDLSIAIDEGGTAHGVKRGEETVCGRSVPDDWTTPNGLNFEPGDPPHYGPTCRQCAQLLNRMKKNRARR